jgi:hypothetical protein
VATHELIQLMVNGAKQSFNGDPEMPLLWYCFWLVTHIRSLHQKK